MPTSRSSRSSPDAPTARTRRTSGWCSCRYRAVARGAQTIRSGATGAPELGEAGDVVGAVVHRVVGDVDHVVAGVRARHQHGRDAGHGIVAAIDDAVEIDQEEQGHRPEDASRSDGVSTRLGESIEAVDPVRTIVRLRTGRSCSRTVSIDVVDRPADSLDVNVAARDGGRRRRRGPHLRRRRPRTRRRGVRGRLGAVGSRVPGRARRDLSPSAGRLGR